MVLVYPGILKPFSDGSGGYVVEFPDLPGCVSEGANLEEALVMGTDAASGWILGELEDENKIPKASSYQDLKSKEDNTDIITLFSLDIDKYAEKYGDRSVRKNLTIPAWMNTYAEKNNINFSQVLQDALLRMSQGK